MCSAELSYSPRYEKASIRRSTWPVEVPSARVVCVDHMGGLDPAGTGPRVFQEPKGASLVGCFHVRLLVSLGSGFAAAVLVTMLLSLGGGESAGRGAISLLTFISVAWFVNRRRRAGGGAVDHRAPSDLRQLAPDGSVDIGAGVWRRVSGGGRLCESGITGRVIGSTSPPMTISPMGPTSEGMDAGSWPRCTCRRSFRCRRNGCRLWIRRLRWRSSRTNSVSRCWRHWIGTPA